MKGYLPAGEIKLIFSGNSYFSALEKLIDESRETLHLHAYIFDGDETGEKIAACLKKAALRKVKVHVLVDAFGSLRMPRELIDDLIRCGIHFRFFAPLFSLESIHMGRRLHYKIAVADKTTVLTGGINIATKYNQSPDCAPWLDYAVLIKGNVCAYLHHYCEMVYYKRSYKWLRKAENHLAVSQQATGKLVRFRINDRLRGKNEIHKSYIEQLKNAKHSIVIVASYFLPGTYFRKLLADASHRGVKLTVLLAGKSDSLSVRLAESYLYNFYLRHNIRVVEWTSTVLHGKAMVVDEEWTTMGSYNLNFLSHYLSMEVNSDIADSSFAKEFTVHLEKIIAEQCSPVELNKYREKTSWLRALNMWLAYNFFRILKRVIVHQKKLHKANG